ncbi:MULTISPECIES: OmpA family protein [unclassified Mycobacterium]|uniref:channel-forming protein ArfA/OmpATb n=1 Tax=unclassified Mycobacterium TaxID=2642494 RepID=UPI0029C69D85|nr:MULTISPECIES: OmpA family protein [unclassified Mycobacterium]
MSGSEEDRAVTGWRTESRFYRRKPGAGWLWALLAIPLLLAVIGWGWLNGTNNSGQLTMPSINPSNSLSVPTAPSAPTGEASVGFPGMSIVRSGNDLTLTGELPDADSKKGLLDSLKLVFPGANLIDKLTVTPGVKAPDMAALGGLFSGVVDIPDFNLNLDGDTLTLTGTAPSEAVKASAESNAQAAWPNVKIVNNIEVNAASPSAPAPPAPGPGAGGACANLQADISSLLQTPINYDTNGFALAANSQGLVAQIADKLKACPDARVAVIGFTDNTGNDAINVPLSGNRAKSVADALVSDGVAADHVSSRGEGSANPVATNDTVQGRSQNRRVEITVS